MNIQEESVGEFRTGKITVTTSPQSLPSFPITKYARLNNVGAQTVLVGAYHLEPGQKVTLQVDDAAKITLATANGSSDVRYILI